MLLDPSSLYSLFELNYISFFIFIDICVIQVPPRGGYLFGTPARPGFEPGKCQSQSLMPYRLATGQ